MTCSTMVARKVDQSRGTLNDDVVGHGYAMLCFALSPLRHRHFFFRITNSIVALLLVVSLLSTYEQ